MSKFSARYARKLQCCDIACKARRKKAIFLTFAPPIRNMDRRPCLQDIVCKVTVHFISHVVVVK